LTFQDERSSEQAECRTLEHERQLHDPTSEAHHAADAHPAAETMVGATDEQSICARALAKQIIKDCEITRIIETGTFFGTTTEFFATFGLPVVTVELNPAHAAQSRERLKTLKNVRLLEMDSISACRNWSMIAAIVLYRLCFISMHTGKSIFLCAPRPNLQFQIFHKQF
jgi:hypothetical protein